MTARIRTYCRNAWQQNANARIFKLKSADPAQITDILIRLQGKPPKMLKTFEKLDRAVEEYR